MDDKHKATAIVIDDHPGALKVACEIMEPDFEILATCGDSQTALDIVSMSNPDILVMDIGLPGVSGFETARQLKAQGRSIKIVFITAMEDSDYANAARDMGSSFVIKRRIRTDLLRAARDTMNGNVFLSPIVQPSSHT